jgi:ABC-2 type transport system permease protein
MALPNLVRLVYRNFVVNTDPGSLIILIGLPAMYLVFFGFGFQSTVGGAAGGSSYLSFLTPGIMSFQAVMAGTVGGAILWSDKRCGMLAQLLSGPFSRLEYLLGIMLSSLMFGLGGSAVMLAVAFAILHTGPTTLLAYGLIFGSITLGSIFFGSLMLFISAWVKSNTAYNSVQILVIFVINFASTVFYPLSPGLPAALKALFYANPLTYIADAVRGAYLGTLNATDGVQMLILVAETAVFLFLAVWSYLRSDVSME